MSVKIKISSKLSNKTKIIHHICQNQMFKIIAICHSFFLSRSRHTKQKKKTSKNHHI